MAIKLVREFKQSQRLSITPQLKKSIDLLQLSRLEIINKINNEIEENPFLQKDFDNESISSPDSTDLLDNLPNKLTLQDHLENQLHDIKLSSSDKKIALVINTGGGNTEHRLSDAIALRRATLKNKVPYCTNMSTALACIEGIKSLKTKKLEVTSLQNI